MRQLALMFLLALGLGTGCAPAIGDSCNSALDCSINGDRQCDLTRPGGACTVFGCEPDNCPDDAVCVRWRPEPSRLTFTACMRRCTEPGNCRADEGYACLGAHEITNPGAEDVPLAEVIDVERGEGRFCVATMTPSP